LAGNDEDHRRNHVLMHEPGRGSLSPAYDINPVPERDRILLSETAVNADQEESTIASALSTAPRFGFRA
jgi:serine/threonine protein kinase HipA of HipAB toxin-antitoxin module